LFNFIDCINVTFFYFSHCFCAKQQNGCVGYTFEKAQQDIQRYDTTLFYWIT